MSCKNNNNNNNSKNNQIKKCQMEDTSFQEKVYIVLNDLIGFSKFCTKIHKFLCCDLEVCEVGEFVNKLDFFLRQQKTVNKTKDIFIDHCNVFPKPFETMFHLSLRKTYSIEYFSSLVKDEDSSNSRPLQAFSCKFMLKKKLL